MSARTAATLPAVVERAVAISLIRGDDVVIQIKNPPTSDRMRENYIGHIEGVILKRGIMERLFVRVPRERTPSEYENILTFVVVDKGMADDAKQKILRRKS